MQTSNSRLTRSSWRTWRQLKLRRKVPMEEGALAVKPSTRAVPPVRSASAASMQSPPASAEATSVIILSPVFARPWRAAEVEVLPEELVQAEAQGQGGRKEQPGISHQASVVEGDLDPVGVVAWQHLSGAPFPGPVFCSKTIIPDSEAHPFASSAGPPHAVVQWIRG